jgi:hypothetical protein
MGAAISIPSGGLFYELSTADAIFQQDIVNLGKFRHAKKGGSVRKKPNRSTFKARLYRQL